MSSCASVVTQPNHTHSHARFRLSRISLKSSVRGFADRQRTPLRWPRPRDIAALSDAAPRRELRFSFDAREKRERGRAFEYYGRKIWIMSFIANVALALFIREVKGEWREVCTRPCERAFYPPGLSYRKVCAVKEGDEEKMLKKR